MLSRLNFIKYIAPILILAFAVFMVFLLVGTKPDAKQKKVLELAWNVSAQTAQLNSHQPIIRLYGQLISRSSIEISSAIDAQVEKRWIENGESVKKGDRLISFDKTRYQLAYDQRLAEFKEIEFLIEDESNRNKTDRELLKQERELLKIAQGGVKRAQTLEKSDMVSGSQIDDASKLLLAQQIAITQRESAIRNHPTRLSQLKQKLQQAKSRLALAKDDLSRTEIRSPVNGYINNVAVNISEQVSRGKIIISLFDSDQQEIRALLPEAHILPLQQALAKNHLLEGFAQTENYQQAIQLDRVSGNITHGVAGTYAYFTLSKDKDYFLIGQTLDVTLKLPAAENTIALPHDALYGTNRIFKITDDHLQRLEIEWLGETLTDNNKTKILIRSPQINPGDLLLTSKFANATHGLKVHVNKADIPKAFGI